MQNHSIFSAMPSPLLKEWPPSSYLMSPSLCWAQCKGCCLPLQCNWMCPGTRLRSVKYKQKCLGETFRKLLRNGADSWTSSFLPAPNSCFQPEIWIRWLTPGVIVNYEALLRMKALAKDDNPRR